MSGEIDLNVLCERLGSIPSFNIHVIDKGKSKPWYEVSGPQLIKDLVIDETNLHQDVVTVAAHVAHWGRLEAQAKRVWEMAETEYRVWRDGEALKMMTPPEDAGSAWKKPPEHLIDATIRTKPAYVKHQANLERAEEAFNAAHFARDAFLAKRDMLKLCVVRAQGNSGPRLSV